MLSAECPECGKDLGEELDDKLGATDILPGNYVSVYCGGCDWRIVVSAHMVLEYVAEAVDAPEPARP